MAPPAALSPVSFQMRPMTTLSQSVLYIPCLRISKMLSKKPAKISASGVEWPIQFPLTL